MSSKMTMVERVARAMCGPSFDADSFLRTPDGSTPGDHRDYWMTKARAAIEAMREQDLRLELYKRRFDRSFVINEEGCFVWTGAIDKRDGYGRFYDGSGLTQTAYGFAWRYHYGEVPSGMVLDHICRNRACVNHDHLRVMTNAENVLIGVGVTAQNATKTHCVHGHPLSGDNLYVKPNGDRDCRACRLDASRRHKAKKRAMIDAALSE